MAAWGLTMTNRPSSVAPRTSVVPPAAVAEISQLFQRGSLDLVLAKSAVLARQFPATASIWFILGAVALRLGRVQKATNYWRRQRLLAPSDAENYLNLADVAKTEGKLAAAELGYRRVITLTPLHALALDALALCLEKAGRNNVAQCFHIRALAANPNLASAYNNLALLYQNTGQHYNALRLFKHALVTTQIVEAYKNRAGALIKVGQAAAAVNHCRRALMLAPDDGEGHFNHGTALKAAGQLAPAVVQFDRALVINPTYAEASWNKALALLKSGNFQEGWQLYEARWRLTSRQRPWPNLPKPLWQRGAPGRLLIWAEQGVGEALIFSSMITELHSQCDHLIVSVDARLIPLLSRSAPPGVVFHPSNVEVDPATYDKHLPMGHLCQLLRANLTQIRAAPSPFLEADSARTTAIRARLGNGQAPIFGLSWRSGSLTRLNKSIDPARLVSILPSDNTVLVNLQYGDTREEIAAVKAATGREIIDLPEIDNFNDIDGLAATVSACDHIITIANVTADLAGGLAKDVCVLLGPDTDWRWLADGKTTPWYPSARLYRQTGYLDWSPVLTALTADLIVRDDPPSEHRGGG